MGKDAILLLQILFNIFLVVVLALPMMRNMIKQGIPPFTASFVLAGGWLFINILFFGFDWI